SKGVIISGRRVSVLISPRKKHTLSTLRHWGTSPTQTPIPKDLTSANRVEKAFDTVSTLFAAATKSRGKNGRRTGAEGIRRSARRWSSHNPVLARLPQVLTRLRLRPTRCRKRAPVVPRSGYAGGIPT